MKDLARDQATYQIQNPPQQVTFDDTPISRNELSLASKVAEEEGLTMPYPQPRLSDPGIVVVWLELRQKEL